MATATYDLEELELWDGFPEAVVPTGIFLEKAKLQVEKWVEEQVATLYEAIAKGEKLVIINSLPLQLAGRLAGHHEARAIERAASNKLSELKRYTYKEKQWGLNTGVGIAKLLVGQQKGHYLRLTLMDGPWVYENYQYVYGRYFKPSARLELLT